MLNYPLIDTHAHYDHNLYNGEGPQIVAQLFEKEIINGVVIPAINYESNRNRCVFPADTFPYVYFAAGLHPKCATNEKFWEADKKAEFSEWLKDPRTVAVKTGLDFSKKLTDGQKIHQCKFFEYLIDQANETDLSLVLHIREAADEAVEVFKKKPLHVEAEVHCYTGDLNTAKKLMDVGVTKFGIGGMLTRDGLDELRACVKELPMSSILIETDAPFVRPKGYEGQVNTSETMPETVKLIAELKAISASTVIDAVQKNAGDFFRI